MTSLRNRTLAAGDIQIQINETRQKPISERTVKTHDFKTITEIAKQTKKNVMGQKVAISIIPEKIGKKFSLLTDPGFNYMERIDAFM